MAVTKDSGGAKTVDTSHPALDNEPRKGVSVESNQIDFNDPTLTLSEQVEQNLVQQNLKAAEKNGDKDAE